MLEQRKLDKSIPTPLYYQLKLIILDEIKKEAYPPGSAIPTEAALSEMFGISITTVRQAVTDLVKEKKHYRVHSKGTFVAKPQTIWEMENRYPSFSERVIASGRTPRIEVLKKELINVPEELKNAIFSFSSDKVVFLKRVRYGDNDPLGYQYTYIDVDKAGFVFDLDFSKTRLMQALEKTKESKVVRICRVTEAALAGKEDVELLGVRKGSAIMKIDSYSLNSNDELVECTISRYKSDEGKLFIEFSI